MLTGVLTGIAGAYISIAQNAGFIRDMTAGQGYIALAALIFGKWKPYNAFGACFLFGRFCYSSTRSKFFWWYRRNSTTTHSGSALYFNSGFTCRFYW